MLKFAALSKVATALVISVVASNQALAGSLTLFGEIKQGSLIIGKTEKGATVTLNDEAILVSEQGNFAFGFGRDEKKAQTLEVTFKDGSKTTRQLTPAAQKYNIQRVEGIAKKIMQPSKENAARAKKDAALVWNTRNITSNRSDFATGFIAPAKGRITGVYGSQRFYNGKAGRPHYGLDYAGKTGTPVVAPASGKVVMYVPDMFYSGGTMIIDHGHGVTSTFLHLSASFVKQGDEVKKGQKVAAIGSTGRSTGPHLDWRVNWKHVKLDPALALEAFTHKQ
ncbi:M23 family metallopeptidase [Thalassotalea marina]|uniref:Periplasmic metalloprotease M23B family protein n=1 Tax=Thalassotalea marina TaxID=1673741 RepID=A0A919BIQ7_9GAMM|nr:M23 family metallopeptidase [Thalassotalea marina]GHF91862.1 periplasmic metalloprotease M23B family protein [Thalassotalea marina]